VTVLDLPATLAGMAPEARERVERLFRIDVAVGRNDPPPEMHDWLRKQFGSLEAVQRQSTVRVTNRWSLDGSLISPLRGRRPVQDGEGQSWAELVAETRGDPFCDPEHQTPAATWGRIRGTYLVTGANAAMYDTHHGLMIFREHDPLAFDAPQVVEMLTIGRQWAERSREGDPEAVNYLLIWNCGPRAGGSVVHGHAQMLLGRGAHYAQVERLRRNAADYASATGGDYLRDLLAAHRDLGLVVHEADEVAIISALAPVKERELLVIGPPGMDEREPAFADAVARLAIAARHVLQVRAFNLALHRPPLAGASEGWERLGPVVHLVDRGDPGSTASDIGAMELYAAAVIGSDPFDIAERLRAAFAAS
jgi:hypothetical protein